MANTNNARKTFTNLSDPQQIRELNRQMEWIWHQLMGGLTEKAFSAAATKRNLITIQNTIAESIKADDVVAVRLKAALAEFVVASIAVADLDLATVTDLISSALTLEQGVADSMYITNLAITSANLLNATIGKLVVKGEDGEYYNIIIGSDGVIKTETVELTEKEIENGITSSGQQIIEETINAEAINGKNIRGNQGIFDKIVTAALSAGKITANDAIIASASIPELYSATIHAIEGSLNLQSNESINIIVNKIVDSMTTYNAIADNNFDSLYGLINSIDRELNRYFVFDENGLVISIKDENGEPASIWSTVTDEIGYHIRRQDLKDYVFSAYRDRVRVQKLEIGNIMVKASSAGGWVWTRR